MFAARTRCMPPDVPLNDSKIDYVDLEASNIIDLSDAFDKLTIYDRPVMVKWNNAGRSWGLIFKYTGGRFGMGIGQIYYDTTLSILSVVNGTKTVKGLVGT